MIIDELKLTNFRNYKKLSIDFGKTTVIIGPNGVGKTNVLEALFILASAKSFRARDENNLINYGRDFAQISAELKKKNTIDFFILSRGNKVIKKVKIDGIEKKFIDMAGKIKAVFFSPESLQIITGPPSARRNFLNLTLVQNSKKYAVALLDLKKILLQRNQLLKQIANNKAKENELDFWDKKLISASLPIIKERRSYLVFINSKINDCYQSIAPKTTKKIEIKYCLRVQDEERFEEILASSRKREIFEQKSLFSPHLDDLEINFGEKSFRETASRGETRSLVVTLKMIELEYLTKDGQEPLILLDDVFSELDRERRRAVLKMISGKQSIVTATEIEEVKEFGENVKIIDLTKIKK